MKPLDNCEAADVVFQANEKTLIYEEFQCFQKNNLSYGISSFGVIKNCKNCGVLQGNRDEKNFVLSVVFSQKARLI